MTHTTTRTEADTVTDDDYAGWIALHCEAVAAGQDAATALRSPINRRAFEEWNATLEELGECTYRLLVNLRVPKFANEHAEAVAVELMELRKERDAIPPRDFSEEADRAPSCFLCGGSGMVTVPLPKCVHQGRLYCYPGTLAVRTGSVLCDAPDCAKGRDMRDREAKRDRPRPTYTAYCRRFGGLDLAGMLRAVEREQAVKVRRAASTAPEQKEIAELHKKLFQRIATQGTDAPQQRVPA